MNLDRRYKWHQAINAGAKGLFGPVITLFCLHRGMDLYQVGLFFGIYYLAIIIFDLPSGVWADKFGRLKVFYWAKLLQCLYFVLLILSDSIFVMIAISFIGGIGRSMSSGTLEAWYYERLKAEDRLDDIGRLLSKIHAWVTVGSATAAFCGAAFVHYLGFDFFPQNPFLPALILSLLIHGFALVSLPFFYHEGESKSITPSKKTSSISVMKITFIKCWMHPLLRAVLLLQLTLGLLMVSLQTYWQPVLQDLLATKTNVVLMGFVAMVFFLCAALASSIIAMVLNKTHIQSERLIFPLFVTSSLLILLLAFVNSPIGFLIFYVAFGFFMLSARPLLGTLMHLHAGDEYRATSLSLLTLMFNFGGVAVGVLFSQIAERLSIDVLWIIMGVLGLLVSFSLRKRVSLGNGGVDV